jgi:hypothetical protein
MKCACGSFMASVVTDREEIAGQMDVRLCTKASCALIKTVTKKKRGVAQDERVRSYVVRKAQRLAEDLKAGRLVWNGKLFIWPAGKGGPGK